MHRCCGYCVAILCCTVDLLSVMSWMNRTLKLGKTHLHGDCIDNTMSVHMVLPDLDTSFSGSVLKVVAECIDVSWNCTWKPLALDIVCDHTFICCLGVSRYQGADCVLTPVFRAVAAWFGCLSLALPQAGQDQCGGPEFWLRQGGILLSYTHCTHTVQWRAECYRKPCSTKRKPLPSDRCHARAACRSSGTIADGNSPSHTHRFLCIWVSLSSWPAICLQYVNLSEQMCDYDWRRVITPVALAVLKEQGLQSVTLCFWTVSSTYNTLIHVVMNSAQR